MATRYELERRTVALYQKQKNDLFQRAFNSRDKNGKYPQRLMRVVRQYDLEMAKADSIVCEIVIIGVQDCQESFEFSGLCMTLDEAIEKQLLPNPNCKRFTGCICSYGRNGLRDEKGALITKW